MSKRFKVKPCHVCGDIEFEDNMLEYNDHFFCGINCKITQERKDDEKLNQDDSGGDNGVVPYRPIVCRDN